MCGLLLANSARVDAENCDGQTALFEAAAAGNVNAAKVLLDAGANPGEGRTDDALTEFAHLLTACHRSIAQPSRCGLYKN
jgi:ankyrin repeat protein